MPIRRGSIYAYVRPRETVPIVGLLVLTNDDWNDQMNSIGGVLVRPEAEPESSPAHPLVVQSPKPFRAIAGRLISMPKDAIRHSVTVLAEDPLALVEDALCEVLALERLCRRPPEQPPSPPGPVDYPRWSEIYYAADRIAGERKRFVVVSADGWNRRTGTAVAVRTTSQQRRWGVEFPSIQNGEARACCGEATTFARQMFLLRPTDRPSPQRLPLQDMVAVARGFAESHDLRSAVGRLGVNLD